MKSLFKSFVVNVLSNFSRKTLAKYHPFVIGVTGNLGKTTTKDYIYNFLKYKYKENVRASEKSQNSEFGVNLTILGEDNAWNNPLAWLKIIIKNFIKLRSTFFFPKILILEVGADKPGDIKYITKIVKPDMVVLTAFQPSPSHGEFFRSIAQHINEKKILVDKMKPDGVIVYNADDRIMTKMALEKLESVKNSAGEKGTSAGMISQNHIKIYSFGYTANTNVQIMENTNLYNEESEIVGLKARFRISVGDFQEDIELRFLGILGDAHAYSLACGILVAVTNGFTKEDIQNSLKNFHYTKSRMRLLQGINNSNIIDDTYNSSPKAAVNAIETVGKILSKGKKIGIFGHMAELGDKTKEEHFRIGLLAAKNFDTLILSGRYNDYFMEGVREARFDLNDLYLADNPEEVINILETKQLVRSNDLILLKGSQSARLEKVVVRLLVNPHDVANVCRQDKEWQKR